jgi:hypothetical protein
MSTQTAELPPAASRMADTDSTTEAIHREDLVGGTKLQEPPGKTGCCLRTYGRSTKHASCGQDPLEKGNTHADILHD